MNSVFRSTIFVATLGLSIAGCGVEAGSSERSAATEASVASVAAAVSIPEVRQSMRKVADWQLQQYDPATNTFAVPLADPSHIADMDVRGWAYAALHVGMSKWAEISESPRYFDILRSIAKKNGYLFAPRIYNADDYAIGQLYIDLYLQDKNPAYILPLKVIFNQILANPPSLDMTFYALKGEHEGYGGMKYGLAPSKDRWSWADATFMGPPVWMKLAEVTGDQRYLEFADSEFWTMADLLFDKEERLFLRDTRFFERRDEDGKKIFWGRGNGWVIAGIARMLESLPEGHPNRARYEELYRSFSSRVLELQQEDGFWRPSLLNVAAYPNPDSSGSAFFVYGLAWGVNQGLLDAEVYMPAINKGWNALVGAVHPDGKLGWVQQVAAKPGSTSFEDTQIYGVGAFLLAGSEMVKLASEE